MGEPDDQLDLDLDVPADPCPCPPEAPEHAADPAPVDEAAPVDEGGSEGQRPEQPPEEQSPTLPEPPAQGNSPDERQELLGQALIKSLEGVQQLARFVQEEKSPYALAAGQLSSQLHGLIGQVRNAGKPGSQAGADAPNPGGF